MGQCATDGEYFTARIGQTEGPGAVFAQHGCMKEYLRNRWIRIGLGIAAVGWTPLLGICALADAGLWHDPNPNPVGPGLLYFFTFWPAIICVIVGIVKVRRSARAR